MVRGLRSFLLLKIVKDCNKNRINKKPRLFHRQTCLMAKKIDSGSTEHAEGASKRNVSHEAGPGLIASAVTLTSAD